MQGLTRALTIQCFWGIIRTNAVINIMRNIDSINNKPPKVIVSKGPTPASQVSPVRQKANGVNLLNLKQKQPPKKILKKILLSIIGIILILASVVTLRAANLSQKIFVGQKTTFFGQIMNMIRGGGNNDKLIGEDLGQINVLLLGIGGEGHDGPYLTDTMILAQIRPDIGQITLTSIPRDYLVDLPDNLGQEKINSAFALGIGKQMDWDKAGSYARQVVSKMSGLQIPYFAVLDFSGFEKAINQVGGVDVTVGRDFTDYQYPDSGTGFLPPQTFTAGPQHMDGARALIFARSRHAAGIEGSDFSRSLRQQKIIEAFKQKVISGNLVKDASNLNSLLSIFADHFHTNMSPSAIFRVYGIIKDKSMSTLSLSLDPDTRLICPEILASNGAYVLVPCRSETDVKNFFKNSFSIGKISAEHATIWLANSTGNAAIYNTAFRKLTDAGLSVYQLNYSKDNLPQSLVYQVNPEPASAEFIANELNAASVNLPPPGVTVDAKKVDIIIVLGQNAPLEDAPAPYIPPPARVASTTDINASTTPTSATSTNASKR